MLKLKDNGSDAQKRQEMGRFSPIRWFGRRPSMRARETKTEFYTLFLFTPLVPGLEQKRGRENALGFSRGGRIETEGFQREIDLLVCESNLFRREIPGRGAVSKSQKNLAF